VISTRDERLGATFDAVLDGIERSLNASDVRRVRMVGKPASYRQRSSM
jgi:hypothetical protein